MVSSDAGRFAEPASLETLVATRKSWHQVAEWLLAGPQYREHGTIRLRIVEGGFATTDGATTVVGNELTTADGRRFLLRGSLGEIAAAAGIEGGAPEGLYKDGSSATGSSTLTVDAEAAAALGHWFLIGDSALRSFAPAESPVLWPEHFDVGITRSEVNYGISLGDSHINEPYAYIGPWRQREGPFWNQSFGAARTWREVSDVDSIVRFHQAGQAATQD